MTTRRLKVWATEHIRAIRWSIVGLMLIIGILGLALGYIYGPDYFKASDTGWGGVLGYFLVNLGPELAGIVIGVVVIDALNDWRQTEQLKAQLIRKMGSNIRDVAIPAARELAYHGWLCDGSMYQADLSGANLAGFDFTMTKARRLSPTKTEVTLRYPNLKGVILNNAILTEANLTGANLEGARLIGANLEEANLMDSNLRGTVLHSASLDMANLTWSNLEGAILRHTSLKETGLFGVNLEGARYLTNEQLLDAKITEGATMPDGTGLEDPSANPPYLDGPTLEEWLATEPDCLLYPEEEEE